MLAITDVTLRRCPVKKLRRREYPNCLYLTLELLQGVGIRESRAIQRSQTDTCLIVILSECGVRGSGLRPARKWMDIHEELP